jgi:hypothetical protein
MGKATLEIVGQKFSAEHVMPLIEAIYQDAIASRKQYWPVALAGKNNSVAAVPND